MTFGQGQSAQFDFDNDGKADISVFRPETGIWYIARNNGAVTATNFGLADDKVVPADYDGDGKSDIEIGRASCRERV